MRGRASRLIWLEREGGKCIRRIMKDVREFNKARQANMLLLGFAQNSQEQEIMLCFMTFFKSQHDFQFHILSVFSTQTYPDEAWRGGCAGEEDESEAR